MNQRGFSLVELMVVIAVIGLLAAIAVPQYQKFNGRARQTEVKTMLSSLFTAETAFFSEWGGYTTNFTSLGFAPVGRVYPNFGFSALLPGFNYCANAYVVARTGISDTVCPASEVLVVTAARGCEGPFGAAKPGYQCQMLINLNGAYVPDCTWGSASGSAWDAYGAAWISKASAFWDVWSINQDKQLIQRVNGL